MRPGDIYSQLAIPDTERYLGITEELGEEIVSFLREQKCTRTLEIGCANGNSAAYIMSATSESHHVIDPHQSTRYENRGVANIERLGMGSRLVLFEDYAHVVLPQLHAEGKRFDFIFEDGNHRFDETFVHFYYADLLLEEGGYIMFHDSWLPAMQMVASWIRTNREDYVLVKPQLRHCFLFQKVGKDQRAWNHFNWFYPALTRWPSRLFACLFSWKYYAKKEPRRNR